MPHPEEPTQLNLDIQIREDPNGNATVRPDRDGFVDPQGRYLVTPEVTYSAHDGTAAVFEFENEGVDLDLVRAEFASSQGAEDGRGYCYLGWDFNEGGLAKQRFMQKLGVPRGAPGSGRTRDTRYVEPAVPVTLEWKDSLYAAIQLEAATTDEFKGFLVLAFTPHHEAEAESL